MEHHHHTKHEQIKPDSASAMPHDNKTAFRLALSATIHCLIGCGIGDILGMVISAHLGWNNLHSILLTIALAFTGGILMGLIPLLRHGFGLANAFKTVILGEGLSIAIMVAFEIIVEVSVPGLMDAHLTDGIFWLGMLLAMVIGFIAALPINYWMIKRGLVKHLHSLQ